MTSIEKKLEYEFADKSLLELALTHSSYANENKRTCSLCNERLEFLGDAILGMSVAEYLYKNEPAMPEGQMTRIRAELVCERSLASVAVELGIGEAMRFGRGEEQNGGRTRSSIIADAVEAVLAAIYLDGGKERAFVFINRFILSRVDEFKANQRDYKTELQEFVQRDRAQELQYTLLGESGPDHSKVFYMSVELNGESIGRGEGRNKKAAEQSAAKDALEKYESGEKSE